MCPFMGWLIIPYLHDLYRVIGTTGMEQLAGGGVAYTVGAVIYARRWPNPSPAVSSGRKAGARLSVCW